MKVHSTKCLHKNMEKSHTNYVKAHLKSLEQKVANTPMSNRCQEKIKLRDENNKIETKTQYKESMRLRVDSLRTSTI